MNRKIKLDSAYELTSDVINDNFHKVKIYIQHDGLNHNGTNFDKENIEKATKTLANIPILAYIKRGENDEAYDLGGHDSELRIEEKDGELYFREHYLEQPIGVIPETNDAYFEEIDGRTYLVAYGFVWKTYSNEAYDIMVKHEKMSVSMEIIVKSLSFKDDYLDITDYEFTGVTVLGTDVPPAMDNASISMSFSTNDEFVNNVKELNSYLKQEFSGKEDVKVEEVQEIVEETVIEGEVLDGEVQEEKEEIVVEDTQEFTEETKEEVTTEEEVVEEIQEETEIVEEVQEESVTPEIVVDEVTYSLEDIVAKFERLAELETFKAEYDAKLELEKLTQDVDGVIAKFDFEEEEISELKEKAMNKEFNLETFELHLEALYGRKMREKKVDKLEFSKENEKLKVGAIVTEKVDEKKMMFEDFKKKYL